jgi:hypothetical protein
LAEEEEEEEEEEEPLGRGWGRGLECLGEETVVIGSSRSIKKLLVEICPMQIIIRIM